MLYLVRIRDTLIGDTFKGNKNVSSGGKEAVKCNLNQNESS